MNRFIVITLLLSFGCSLAFCAAEIPLLKRVGAGQPILHYVKEHKQKSGTPTMGGLGFVLAAAIVSFVLLKGGERPYQASLAVGIGYLLVGLTDDLLKKQRQDNLGLKPYQKILFQLAVAVIAAVYCYLSGATNVYVPFLQRTFDLGVWVIPFGIIVFLATVNSVNLTDGLDGLAGATSSVFFIFLGAVMFLQGQQELHVLSFSLAGALFAYLIFNVNRASVFMGDTGSLSLGGFAAALTLFSGNALLLPLLGIMFVFSSISVILQVIYYKTTGKRVFLMAPAHHHFQQRGYSESKITYVYAVVTAVIGLALLLPYTTW